MAPVDGQEPAGGPLTLRLHVRSSAVTPARLAALRAALEAHPGGDRAWIVLAGHHVLDLRLGVDARAARRPALEALDGDCCAWVHDPAEATWN